MHDVTGVGLRGAGCGHQDALLRSSDVFHACVIMTERVGGFV